MALVNPSLFRAMEQAMLARQHAGVPLRDISQPMPDTRPDLFSNDYLSLATDPHLRRAFLDRLSKTPYVLGTGGTRVLCGSPGWLLHLEERMAQHWAAPAALLCNSGYDGNVAFFRTVPQKTDAIIFDELVHASILDGIRASRASHALYSFSHNSLDSLRECVLRALELHPDIAAGRGTLFISLLSAYSMDGDFAPLPEIVTMVEELVLAGAFHIVVDEAHTTGLYGPGGKGVVSALGLDNRIHTVLHTFGKACGFSGAVLLTAPLIKMYMGNYARHVIYSNSLPHCHIEGIHAILDYLSSPIGDKLRNDVFSNVAYFEPRLRAALEAENQSLLSLPPRMIHPGFPENLTSPIFPVLTPTPIPLAKYLQSIGYDAQPIPYPAVPRGKERIRIIVHAGNTKKDFDDLIDHLVDWIREHKGVLPRTGKPDGEGEVFKGTALKAQSSHVQIEDAKASAHSCQRFPKMQTGHSLRPALISPFNAYV